jgi:hypothetical protein
VATASGLRRAVNVVRCSRTIHAGGSRLAMGWRKSTDGSLAWRLRPRGWSYLLPPTLLWRECEPADEVDVVFGDDWERLGCRGGLEAEFAPDGDCLGLGEVWERMLAE